METQGLACTRQRTSLRTVCICVSCKCVDVQFISDIITLYPTKGSTMQNDSRLTELKSSPTPGPSQTDFSHDQHERMQPSGGCFTPRGCSRTSSRFSMPRTSTDLYGFCESILDLPSRIIKHPKSLNPSKWGNIKLQWLKTRRVKHRSCFFEE